MSRQRVGNSMCRCSEVGRTSLYSPSQNLYPVQGWPAPAPSAPLGAIQCPTLVWPIITGLACPKNLTHLMLTAGASLW